MLEKILKMNSSKKEEVLEYLTSEELEKLFDYNRTLQNIDIIFKRTVEA